LEAAVVSLRHHHPTLHDRGQLELGETEPVQELLIATDSYSSVSERQEQRVEAVSLVDGGATALRVQLHHERRVCSKPWEECRDEDFHPADPPPGNYELDFVLKGSRLVIAPASEALVRQLFPEHAKYLPDGIISNGSLPEPR
jgi:hypothetical protein